MAQLRRDFNEFTRRETTILVIGPEDAAAFNTYFSANDLPFIGLPDPNHQVLKKYGQEIKLFKYGRMPAQVLVDKTGTARFVHYGHDMTDIPDNAEILALIEQLESQAVA
jgi:peroxiredoxin Q/BCP